MPDRMPDSGSGPGPGGDPGPTGGGRADGSAPLPVRLVRGTIAVLVWGALTFPIGGMFRWVGDVLAMPPSYTPAWRTFVVAVGAVLFFAFVFEPARGGEGHEDGEPQ